MISLTTPNPWLRYSDEYLTKIASGIGYNNPIPDDYDNDDVLIALIAKYDSHHSILSIKSSLP